MRDYFPGYYRATEEELAALWGEALVVPDTSVLLALYRLPDRSREKLIEILGRLQGRLFVPYQVAAEFQRNRASVIERHERAYETVIAEVKRLAARVAADLSRHPRLEKADLEARISGALAPVVEHLECLRGEHPAPLVESDPLGTDTVRDALDGLFAGRVGPERDREELVQEGVVRYAEKRPPGYLDADKPEPERYGDLAIWLDVLAKAKAEELPVILITEERKEDWWWKDGNQLVAPRVELVAEMARESGQRLHLKSLDRFMEEASDALELDFTDEERAEVVAARQPDRFDPAAADWKIDHQLRERAQRELDAHGWEVQGRAGFLASPDSGRTFYGPPRPMGFPTSPGPGPGWRGSVREGPYWSDLEIHWEPRPSDASRGPFGRLTCIVKAPDGDAASATDSGGELSAYLRFPDEFRPLFHPAPGTYVFEWFFEGPDRRAGAVGSGAFVLGEREPPG